MCRARAERSRRVGSAKFRRAGNNSVRQHFDREDVCMFAIFEDGSHQYRVEAGDELRVDFRDAAKTGDALNFDRVLAAGSDTSGKIGRPVIEGASVTAEVLDVAYDRKLEIGKFKRRKGHIRHNGHTQKYTAVKITAITVPGLAD
jgi:large subunit ribosomal protein L21